MAGPSRAGAAGIRTPDPAPQGQDEQRQQERRPSSLKELLLAGVSSGVVSGLTTPIFSFAVSLELPSDRVFMRAVPQGMGVMAVGGGLRAVCKTYLFSLLRPNVTDWLEPFAANAQQAKAWSLLVANLAAEVISDVVYAPFVCLNLRMLTSEHLSRVGAIDAAVSIVGQEGLSALYDGFRLLLLRQMLSSSARIAAQFRTTVLVAKYTSPHSPHGQLAIGTGVGVVCATLSQPTDYYYACAIAGHAGGTAAMWDGVVVRAAGVALSWIGVRNLYSGLKMGLGL